MGFNDFFRENWLFVSDHIGEAVTFDPKTGADEPFSATIRDERVEEREVEGKRTRRHTLIMIYTTSDLSKAVVREDRFTVRGNSYGVDQEGQILETGNLRGLPLYFDSDVEVSTPGYRERHLSWLLRLLATVLLLPP